MSLSLPRISVLIPAYNAADTLAAALESALTQTFPAHEILVIDDGSTDNTAEVARGFGERVRLLQQTNGGPGAARNRGAQAAVGDWFALLDADDTWLPNRLERQILLTRSERIGVIHALEHPGQELPPADLSFDLLWQKNRIGSITALIRREAFVQVGGFDEDRAIIGVEDYNLWLRLAAAGWQFALVPEQLARYTPAANSLTNQTARLAQAELANAVSIGRRLNLPDEQMRKKRHALYDEYGRALFYYRQMRPARHLLASVLRECPTPVRLAWWGATFLPPRLRDWRRGKRQESSTVFGLS